MRVFDALRVRDAFTFTFTFAFPLTYLSAHLLTCTDSLTNSESEEAMLPTLLTY